MGHERVGILPKTKPWKNILKNLAEFDLSDPQVDEIAINVIENVRDRFENIYKDKGINAAFNFFITLAMAASSDNPVDKLRQYGITISEKTTPLQLSIQLKKWVDQQAESLEYATIATQAGADTIIEWKRRNQSVQLELFDSGETSSNIWVQFGKSGEFSELSRIYFGNFTERYLKYYLDRETSSTFFDVNKKSRFDFEIKNFSYETAKIMQSFAAGWFQNHVHRKEPTEREIKGFLKRTFGKLSEELRREVK